MKKVLIIGLAIFIIVIAILCIYLMNVQAQNKQLQQINVQYEQYIRKRNLWNRFSNFNKQSS